jgi:3-carboxy-cis,cis-muconate cycloisomerase
MERAAARSGRNGFLRILNPPTPIRVFDPLFTTDAMREAFADQARLQAMLDFAAALARAETRVGIVPPFATAAIEANCRAELFDAEALAREAAAAGNLAIPLLKQLTARVAASDPRAAGFVHWGATSQDMIDTGLVLQLRRATALIAQDLARLADALAALAAAHKRTPLAGRTWLQQATPVTFGLKAAGWLSAIGREGVRWRELAPRAFVIQFGGAAGTLAALGDDAIRVADALADDLGLRLPEIPWHTQRDRVAEAATALGLTVGTLGKIARDVSLLMQTEVGEAIEPNAPGHGGSSTMPHKQNPVGCAVVLAAATRVPALVSTMLSAMVQEHERGLGGWQAEWETLPEIFRLAAGALAQAVRVIEGLHIDPERMRANLDVTHGLILAEAVTMALARHIGRAPAHALLEAACREAVASGRHLRDVLSGNAEVTKHLSAADLDRLLDPANYLGVAEQLVERVLTQRAHQTRST